MLVIWACLSCLVTFFTGSYGCDFAQQRRHLEQEPQDGLTVAASNETAAGIAQNETEGMDGDGQDTTQPPSTMCAVVDPSSSFSALLGVQVDLKMLAYQARGTVKVRNQCQFSVQRLELVAPTAGSSATSTDLIELKWYAARSLTVDDVRNKTLLVADGRTWNATVDFIGDFTYDFTTIMEEEDTDYHKTLQDVGAILLTVSMAGGQQDEMLVASALIQKLIPGPAADLLAPQPTILENCWTVGEDVRIRWTVDYENQYIDWGLEYVSLDPANTWMAIGPAFPGSENRLMGGSDVVIGGFRQEDTDTDEPFVDDFFIGGYEVCTLLPDGSLDGVCRDSLWTGNEEDNNVELLYAHALEGVAFLRVRRPLQGTTPRFDHAITPGIAQNLLWARGPLSPVQGIADIQFHGYRYGELKNINIKETIWNCAPLKGINFDGDAVVEPADFDSSSDAFAEKFEQSVMLPGNHMEIFWTLFPDSDQIYLGARANAPSSSKWISIAVGESMTDSWAWVASFAGEEPNLLTYRLSGLDASTVRMTSEQNEIAMMKPGTSFVQREEGRLSFETMAQWPLPGMMPGMTGAPIIYAVGPSWDSDQVAPKREDEHFIRSAAPTTIDFATGASRVGDKPQNTMFLLHGIFMWLAWLVLAPMTSIASRYFRDDPCVPAGSSPSWIQLHKYGASTVLALSVIGMILSIVATTESRLGHFLSVHGRIGMALVAMIVIQNFFGLLRPDPDNPPVPLSFSVKAFTKRRLWACSHRLFAISMLSMGIAAVITGLQRLESFDSRTRHSVALSLIWIAMVVLLLVLYEFRKYKIVKTANRQESKAEALKQSDDHEEEALEPEPEVSLPVPSKWISSRLWVYGLPAAVGAGALVAFAVIAFSGSLSSEMKITVAGIADQAQPTLDSVSPSRPEVEAPEGCSAYPASHLGDGWCDDFEPFNTAPCGWDAGDCCNKTTSGIYNCKDPLSPIFGTSSPRGWWGGVIPRNPRYTAERDESLESLVTTYNNYYEFGTSKTISDEADKHADFLKATGWFIDISGLVENPMTLNVESFIRQIQLEERMYRHRCVEAWSITSPWIGFPLTKLLDIVRPLPEAGIVRFVSWENSEHSITQTPSSTFPWPYTEALTMAEARNELTMLTVGNFQKPLTPSQGAPIRLTVPWKFGYKSIKSIEQMSFLTDGGPGSESRRTFWSEIIDTEYGFWSNINPEVPHRRWSQATDRHYVSGFPGQRLDTVRMNGYQENVDYLYEDVLDDPKIYF
jgi:methionine sulfoxide reductase catalytic subunit